MRLPPPSTNTHSSLSTRHSFSHTQEPPSLLWTRPALLPAAPARSLEPSLAPLARSLPSFSPTHPRLHRWPPLQQHQQRRRLPSPLPKPSRHSRPPRGSSAVLSLPARPSPSVRRRPPRLPSAPFSTPSQQAERPRADSYSPLLNSFTASPFLLFLFVRSNPANIPEVCKTRLQLQGELAKGSEKVYSSVFDVAKKTWKNEGIRGLQRGLGTAVRHFLLVSRSWEGREERTCACSCPILALSRISCLAETSADRVYLLRAPSTYTRCASWSFC